MTELRSRTVAVGIMVAAAVVGTSAPASAATAPNVATISTAARSDDSQCVMRYRPSPRLVVVAAPVTIGPTVTVTTDCGYTGQFTVHVESSSGSSVEVFHSDVQSDTEEILEWPIYDHRYVPGVYHLGHAVGSDYGGEHWSVDYGRSVTIKYATAARLNRATIVGRDTVIAGQTLQYSRVNHQLVPHTERLKLQLLNRFNRWVTVSALDSQKNGTFEMRRIGRTGATRYRIFVVPTSRLGRSFSAAKSAAGSD